MIPGFSANNGFTLNLQDRTGGDINDFFNVAKDFIAELQKRPEIQTAQTNFNTNFPQLLIDIDAAQCKRAGISPAPFSPCFRATTAASIRPISTASVKSTA